MEGTIKISEFVDYLAKNNLVVAPASMLVVDKRPLKNKLLAKKTATYKEISESGIWGDISQKRAYQIAKENTDPMEIIKPGNHPNAPEKIVITAIKRIAQIRESNHGI